MRKTEGVYLLLAVTAYCADGGVIQRVLSSRAQGAVFGSGQTQAIGFNDFQFKEAVVRRTFLSWSGP